LPKELGKLISLKELRLQNNGFTATEEEKAALKAKLPRCKIQF